MSLGDDLKAIKPLFSSEWVISLLKACRTMNEGRADHQEWIDAAIRLLEAAGKVDKQKALALYDRMKCPDSSRLTKKELRKVAVETSLQIHALLKALPEEEEK